MSTFHYRAFDATGQTVAGVVEADSLPALETHLRSAGSWLLEAREGATLAAEERRRVSRLRLGRRDRIVFYVQVALLLRAGITLPNALDRLAEDFTDTRIGVVARELAAQIAAGVPLHEALGRFPRVFSGPVVAMVRAGEVSGRLPEIFQSLSAYYEWLDQLLADVRQALTYPLIVSAAALALVLLLFTFVVPRFVSLLGDLSLGVPLLTRGVLAVSTGLLRGWPLLVLVLVGGPVALTLARRVPRFAVASDRALMRIPVFGTLASMFALSRFAHHLGMLYESGVPLLRSLEICAGVVGNAAMARALDEVRQGVLEGTPMSRSLGRHDLFPRTVVTMIATGEASGHLDTALRNIGEYYNNIIPRRVKAVFAIFNPVVMIALIAVVGIVALSVILPILQLWEVR